jgi:CheY-like chemotaxis protein
MEERCGPPAGNRHHHVFCTKKVSGGTNEMSRILIIEDEEAIADLEKDYLELSGFEVEIANRGDVGLEKALKEEYDLIILDLMLPEVDGFDICRQVRQEKNIPIIMVSAKKDDIDKILDIFKVSRDEKDKYAILNTWFVKRFMPAYKSFMQAMWSVNNSIYLDEIDKFKPVDLYNFVTRLSIPTVIYDIEQVPTFDDTRVYHSKTQVDEMLVNVTNMAKEQANMKDSNAAKKVAEENKRAKDAASQKQQPEQKKEEETKAATPPPKQPPPEQAPGDSDSPPGKEKSEGEKTEAKAAAKLSKASGEIYPGSTSLEGISTALKKEKIYNLDPNVRSPSVVPFLRR